jgi:hypothetical protein
VRPFRWLLGAAASVLLVTVTACGGTDAQSVQSPAKPSAQSQNAPADAKRDVSADDFSRSLFDQTSADIDNPWVAFKPGKRFTWTGSTEEDGERVRHRIIFTVTDMTKVINGVRTRVGWDRDFSGGKLIESELIFLAEDKAGNVWHFGQYSEMWDGPEYLGGQVWLPGRPKGAKAGIYMRAEPRLGSPPYSEGFAPPPYYWDDWGKVDEVGVRNCVPVGCHNDVIVVDEYEPTKPGAHQLKYYARGVGNIRTGWRGKDADREVLVLRNVSQLNGAEVAKARQAVRQHEDRAFVYASTRPAEPPAR